MIKVLCPRVPDFYYYNKLQENWHFIVTHRIPDIWAGTSENLSSGVSDQVRHKPGYAITEYG